MGFDALTYVLAQKMGGGSSGGESMVTGQKIYGHVFSMPLPGGEKQYTLVISQNNSVRGSGSLVTTYELGSADRYSYGGDVPWNGQQFSGVTFDGDIKLADISYWFSGAYSYVNYTNLTTKKMVETHAGSSISGGFPGGMPNGVEVMYKTFYETSGSYVNAVCPDSVRDFVSAYENSYTNRAACGNGVTNMYRSYYRSTIYKGPPVCGPNVIDMSFAYHNADFRDKTNARPVCGDNVINMRDTYYGIRNLTGSPVCGNNVTNMYDAYTYCYNLTGQPVCGNNVTNMAFAYQSCYNLTGSPACGSNVKDISYAYSYCERLSGNSYFYSPNVGKASGCFEGCASNNAINIYVKKDSQTFNTLMLTDYYSICGSPIEWSNEIETNGRYCCNKGQIYVYPVDDVEAARIANGD